MTTFLRVATATAAAIILAACAVPASRQVAENPNCPTQTGSRIAGDAVNCSGFGRSYTHDDISRTGSANAGEALRLLDPSVTVGH